MTHVCVLFKDLTAEMVQRGLLEEERELLSAIVDQASDGIVMSDAGGTLRLVNRAARELGIRPGEQVEADLPLARALRGETARAIVQRRVPDGTTRALSAVAVPLRRSDGSLRGAVSTFRDETERVRHEQEVLQTAHFRERFIGILGHDLRTPLTAILGSAMLVLRQRALPDPVLASAARINASAERMGRMISDLLDFTQARLGGGLALERKPGDLAAVAQGAVDEALAANPGREVLLAVDGDSRGDFDPDRIAQLLSNLLVNALAYGPAEEPVRVSVRGREQRVEIAVENGGTEIPDGDRESLFDPFRRGRTGQKTRGLGLGLFIVQQIARAHGGDVAVESSPGRTVFTVTLGRAP